MTTVADVATDRATGTGSQLRFVEPLPGFADEADYTLDPIDERGLLYSLRSVHQPALRFVLTPAGVFFADYEPQLEPAVAGVLGGSDVDVLLMLTIGRGLADATANLRAPIVVCPGTGRAVQVILDDESLPMHQPLVAG